MIKRILRTNTLITRILWPVNNCMENSLVGFAQSTVKHLNEYEAAACLKSQDIDSNQRWKNLERI